MSDKAVGSRGSTGVPGIIVMDITKKIHNEIPSKHQDAKTDGVPRTGDQFLDYWMQMIQEKSDFKDFDPAVAIILTHLDQVTTSEAKEYVSGLINYVYVMRARVRGGPEQRNTLNHLLMRRPDCQLNYFNYFPYQTAVVVYGFYGPAQAK